MALSSILYIHHLRGRGIYFLLFKANFAFVLLILTYRLYSFVIISVIWKFSMSLCTSYLYHVQVNSKATLMFSGMIDGEVHDNVVWPEVPYVTDEHGGMLES